jgi:iron complex transport system permease protein
MAASGRRDAPATRLLILAVISLAALLLSLTIGAADVPAREVLAAVTGRGDATARAIVLDLRLPRALLALVAGGGLALSGAVFQALLRNPLAEPYVLGVSNGAAVGAVALVVTGVARAAPALIPIAALVGALAAVFLVFRIATQVGRGLDTRVLLLAGVVVGAFLNAIILLLLTFADVESFRSAIFWMMGSLAGASWGALGLVALYTFPAAIGLTAFARAFNLISLGEETAAFLGARVERVKVLSYVVASLLVAASVAVCGVIGFIGLVVPHALRMMWGSDHRLLLPGSFLAGGAFLLLTDTAARTLAAPAELPVGVITALVGVPFFVVLLRRTAA